jgi:hypothetical protein
MNEGLPHFTRQLRLLAKIALRALAPLIRDVKSRTA